MSRTRVGLVCGYLEPRLDGVADYTRRLAAQLRAIGFEPLILTTRTLAQAAGGNAVGVTRRWDARGVVSAARMMRRMDLDLVHVQFAPSVYGFSRTVGLLPLFLPRRVPLLVTLHEYGVWSGYGPGQRIRSALWSVAEHRGVADRETLLLTPRARLLLIPSPEHLDVLRARLGERTPLTREVPIGVNVAITATGSAQARADVRRELDVGSDTPIVAFFGFLHPEKALDHLIAAVAALQPRWPGIQLLLIGGAVSHSVPARAASRLRAALEQVAAAHGMQDQVHFTGYVPDAEVSRLLRATDVAVFPFDAGVTRKSSSLLTALASGVPAVVTAPLDGEASELSEVDGVLRVPSGRPSALTDALARVLGDQTIAAQLTAAGRMRLARQSWDVIGAAHAEVYRHTLAVCRYGESWTEATEPSRVVPSMTVEGGADVTA
jgi:glycosyltransferase involved in cell wall biosynthesis